MCEDKALQVRCSREMWPVSLPDDEILDERCNFPIGLIHDANLVRDAIPGNVKQSASIGKPAAPARAKIYPRREPSGDHVREQACRVNCVTWRTAPPCAATMPICPRYQSVSSGPLAK